MQNQKGSELTVAEAQRGKKYRILGIDGPGPGRRENLMRMGLGEGSLIECISIIGNGPVLIRHGRTDIAIGRGMAQCIVVEPVLETFESADKGGKVYGKGPWHLLQRSRRSKRTSW